MLELTAEARENLFPLNRVGAHLPLGRNGRPVSGVTAWRWAKQGLAGVRLETVRIGACRFTSMAALTRFFQQVDAARGGRPAASPGPRTAGQRQRASEEAHRRLAAKGRYGVPHEKWTRG